jgi:hypothetical protein
LIILSLQEFNYIVFLAYLFLNVFTGPTGAGSFARHMRKMKSARYLEDGSVYVQVLMFQEKKKSTGLMSYGFSANSANQPPKMPFPPMDLHWGGYSATKGPSEQNIAKVFLAMNANLKNFAHRAMMSIGYTLMATDATYLIASRIHDIVNGVSSNPINNAFTGIEIREVDRFVS